MNDFREFGWDDEITEEGKEYILLPEGNYRFLIKNVERARYGGGEKMPPCNMAKVTFEVQGAEGNTYITENFFLCSTMEWKLSSLFLALGMKKHGEPLRMNWGGAIGKTGVCKVYIDKYIKKDGSEGTSNKISKLYAYDDIPTNIIETTPKTSGAWKAGAF